MALTLAQSWEGFDREASRPGYAPEMWATTFSGRWRSGPRESSVPPQGAAGATLAAEPPDANPALTSAWDSLPEPLRDQFLREFADDVVHPLYTARGFDGRSMPSASAWVPSDNASAVGEDGVTGVFSLGTDLSLEESMSRMNSAAISLALIQRHSSVVTFAGHANGLDVALKISAGRKLSRAEIKTIQEDMYRLSGGEVAGSTALANESGAITFVRIGDWSGVTPDQWKVKALAAANLLNGDWTGQPAQGTAYHIEREPGYAPEMWGRWRTGTSVASAPPEQAAVEPEPPPFRHSLLHERSVRDSSWRVRGESATVDHGQSGDR